jgi:type II secretory ATPase GspE/PulE/Tfp pilus assembly ATPase PilB-like protein
MAIGNPRSFMADTDARPGASPLIEVDPRSPAFERAPSFLVSDHLSTEDAEEAIGRVMLDERPDATGPAVVAVHQILAQAIAEDASDIHLEPHRQGVVIRFRVDGVMYDRFTTRSDLAPAIQSRIKVLAKMNVAEHRLPQDGRFSAMTQGRDFDVRVSSVPGVYGEKSVLRILPKNKELQDLKELGLDGENQKIVENRISQPYGMVLVTGPTGSGKTTTLYSALRDINSIGKNVITIEDPVEYELSRVTQIQVHPKIGLSFASGLRSILRQDPDVVMVGEIRDLETLNITIQAALTGHLVLSTLHCNDAASAAVRCIDMGTEPFLFTSATTAIVAQRLVRKVCRNCAVRRELTAEQCALLGLTTTGSYAEGRGCAVCRQTGYKGRTAVYEVLRMTEPVRAAIHRRESSSTIRQIALQDGMKPLRYDAVRKMLSGVTTPEEVLRSVYLEL